MPRKKVPLPAFLFPLPPFGKITAAAVGVIILVGSGWFYKRADGSEATTYRTATIQRGSVKPTVSSTGTLSAVKTIQVGTQVSGQVAAIYADFNQPART